MWWTVAAAALPYVMASMQKKPKVPGGPAPVQLADRRGLDNQMIDMAFNPHNKAYEAASDKSMDQVNRALGRKGMLGSSIGMQMQGSHEAELANKWMEESGNRQIAAYNAITGHDRLAAGLEGDNSAAAYKYAMDMYKDQTQRNTNQVQGVGNMVNAGVGAYNQSEAQKRYDHMIGYNQPPPAPVQPSYGVPGYLPPTNYQYQMPAYNYQPGTQVA